jgi:chemotaxis protein CheY-P-specific phosphatase CheC
MDTPVLICDDSRLARKQMARCLPDEWKNHVEFAEHGQEAIEKLKQLKQGCVLFLDLNMPVMDGYEVLANIKKLGLEVLTIVVSGDVQPEAYERVIKLGALDFIKKPVDKELVDDVLDKFGINKGAKSVQPSFDLNQYLSRELRDVFQEITNVSMGQAGALLAQNLNVVVQLPIPNVNVMEVSELHMALQSIETNDSTSGVCQGFIGGGVSGEALLILNDSSFADIANILNYQGDLSDDVQLELLMDIGNILIGAILTGLAEQLQLTFSQGHPVVLGQHCNVSDLIKANAERWKRTLTIEVSYGIENYHVAVDLLLVFTEDSMDIMRKKVEYLLEDLD